MNEDLRVIKTKKAIEDALLSLLEIMPFSKVRMIHIAEKAMVNRNTIYLHYNSKEEIVISIISRQFSDNYSELSPENLFPTRYNIIAIRNGFKKMLSIIEQNIDLYRITLMDNNLSGYVKIFIDRIKNTLYSNLKPTKKNLLGVEYIVNGAYGVVSRWIIYATGDIDEVTNILVDFTLPELRRLRR